MCSIEGFKNYIDLIYSVLVYSFCQDLALLYECPSCNTVFLIYIYVTLQNRALLYLASYTPTCASIIAGF